ncbi:hypothetical protein K469DRAFT_671927 [Zopfia rhizophila CBS 207.26]|uniref:Uncharacterized protein n=1 Tax=Zopfia rhizophila CBS 207.26 TaxID=1314779 RepID=A0A6A6DPN3_9PEZI|nr:hypothetical protein K469DRAFT_671927 [Zopfia rhizophila CBS 207.26]
MEDHNDPAPNGAVAIDGSSDEEGYSSPPDDSDDDELANLRPCTYTLGISRYYSPNWTRQDAFREYYQNWKDAIIASYDLEPRNFKPELKETGDQIQITVHRPHPSGPRNSSMELLGYIRFRKKAGCVELANFKAQLNMEHLLLGRTTKRGHDRFAGHHGEGFKIASLVMRRNEHAVRYAASSYYWNFRFRRRSPTLSCILSRANPEVLQRKKEAFSTRVAAGARRGLTSNIWEDVIVRISKARGECGSKVTEADFRSWLDVTLDINRPPPSDFIETCYGDMILDARFSGQIYLKGLRVPGDGGDGRVYIFGYNFHRGQIDRDRRKLGNAQEETRMIANIWEQAMIARGDEVVDSYIKLFRDHEHSLDINLADRTVSRSAAQAIWNRLRTSFPDAFFYPEKVSSDFGRVDQGETIVRNLKKQPQSLPAALWRLLRTYSLARTPLEETIHLFSNSTAVAITQDMFALNILRCLKASMLLNQTLKDIRFEVVTGGNTEVNILFKPEQNVILIHQKWTGFRKVHTFSNCDAFSMIRNEAPNPRAFYCDHVVEDLFELALNTIRGVLKLSQQDCMTLRRAARKLVQQMPRLVRISQNAAPMELEVSWTGNEGGLVSKTCAASINYNVILHKKSTCWPLFSDILLHLHGTYVSLMGILTGAPCSCVRQVVSHIESKAIFRGLDHEEEYFPMVSRVENGSLFGVPPPPIAPNGAIGNHEPSTTLMEFPVLNSTTRTRTPSPESRTGDSSLPIASDGFEDINEVDDNANQSHGNTHTTAVNTSRRRIRAQAGLRQGSHRTDMVHQDAYEKDEKTWETWQEKELPDTFARLTPKRGMNNLV